MGHQDLVIFEETTYEQEHLTIYGIINKDVNMSEQQFILQACFVEVSVIYTYPNFSTLSSDWYDVGCLVEVHC